MTVKQREWQDVFDTALKAKIDELHATKQVPSKDDISRMYSAQRAEELYESGEDPKKAADFVAMSLLRQHILNEVCQLTVKKRSVTDDTEKAQLEAQILDAQHRYNELMGTECFPSEKKPLHEGVELPTMICWGRGYGEGSNPMDTSVISRYNNLVARNDPYTGQVNPVLSRLQQFEANNASKYTVDPDPELDKYVDTLFIEDMGPEAFTVNGENPYRVLDKIRAGEEVDIPVRHGVAARPTLPDVTKETPAAEPGYVESFNDLFSPGN